MPKEILIVDDSRTQLALLQHLLEQRGYKPRTARDGREALESARAERPALVISDVMMPTMNGYEMCRAMKDDPTLRGLPVILVTTLSELEDIVHGLNARADFYLTKPYDPDYLIDRVETLLSTPAPDAEPDGEPMEILLTGRAHIVTAGRAQMLRLLSSTYQNAIEQNRKLIATQLDLQTANESLQAALTDVKHSHEQLRDVQAQLIEAEKLRSVARLAAGVAHEIKNPLATIGMAIEFFGQQQEGDEILGEIVKEATSALARADAVIRGLLDYSAPENLAMQDAEVNAVIKEALTAAAIPAQITVTRDLAENLPRVKVDPAKIVEALRNIVTNAVQAMGGKGPLTVRSSARQLTGVGSNIGGARSEAFRAGDNVVTIEIEDCGSGIPADKLSKVFDPFFTTRPTGQGTGLGLTVAKTIVDLHGGTLDLANRSEGGARATVMLRASA